MEVRAGQRRVLGILLLVTAAAGVTPLVALGVVWTGSSWLSMWARDTHNPLSLAFAALYLALPLLVGSLVFGAIGVHRGVRGTYWPAWIGLLGVLGVGLGPVGNLASVSWVPGGRVLLLALGLTCAVLLVRTRPAPSAGRNGRRWLYVGLAILGCYVLLVVGLTAVAGGMGGLPNDPAVALTGNYQQGPAQPRAFPAAQQPQNPQMAKFPWAAIHNDAAQSDAYPGSMGVDPRTGVLRSWAAGGVCASLTWNSRGQLATVCVSDTVTAHLVDPATMTSISSYKISDRPLSADFFTSFGGGGYMYLDNLDRLVTPTLAQTILVLAATTGPHPQLAKAAEYDIASALGSGERPTSVLPDPAGRLWFVGGMGTVGYVDPATSAVTSVSFPGEGIENSFAVGRDGDVYVVTSRALKRLRVAPDGHIQQRWSSTYDAGTGRKSGQTSAASGTTPTLHGDGLVSIADNGEQLHVNVYRVADGSRVCSVPVFEPGEGATENSLVALGSDLLVENNFGYKLLDAVGGHTAVAGIARVNVDQARNTCAVAWSNGGLHVPSVVSKVVAGDGVMLTYTKDPQPIGIDNWWFTGVDVRTGQVAWRRLAGTGSARNNHYAAIYLGPDGGIYVGTAMGIVALQRS